jgi:regulator of replication initiation timing
MSVGWLDVCACRQVLSPVERARVTELEEENRRLRMENEFLKKQQPSSRGRTSSRAVRSDRRGEGGVEGL